MNNGNNGFDRDLGGGTEAPSENKNINGFEEPSLSENAENSGADIKVDVENGHSQVSGSPNEKTTESEGSAYTEHGAENKSAAVSERNMAELLNSYLFDEGAGKVSEQRRVDPEFLKTLWKKAGFLVLTALVAFFGAFACVYYVCNTALLGDSDFFATLMLKNSGVTVNRIETDMISGSYIEDTTELAEKISECSAAIRVYSNGESIGSGSAVILSEDGIAVTNYHVVYGYEDSLNAELCDGTWCDVEVLHLDKISDIAVIKIKSGKKLTAATFGDSEKARAGQSIAVCGNPLGLEFSVSFGKISHPDRDLGESAGNYIQIDASVNPGNSGGGLFDAAGNLIGIVNAKASGTDVDGIGYAIPSARIITVMNDLLKQGYVSGRPAIGLTLVQVTSSTWDHFKNGNGGSGKGDLYEFLYGNQYGIYIMESKYTDELQKGDRIVSCGKRTFTDRDDFSSWLLKYSPGDTVDITVERIISKSEAPDGSILIQRSNTTVTCTLSERDWIDEPYRSTRSAAYEGIENGATVPCADSDRCDPDPDESSDI